MQGQTESCCSTWSGPMRAMNWNLPILGSCCTYSGHSGECICIAGMQKRPVQSCTTYLDTRRALSLLYSDCRTLIVSECSDPDDYVPTIAEKQLCMRRDIADCVWNCSNLERHTAASILVLQVNQFDIMNRVSSCIVDQSENQSD